MWSADLVRMTHKLAYLGAVRRFHQLCNELESDSVPWSPQHMIFRRSLLLSPERSVHWQIVTWLASDVLTQMVRPDMSRYCYRVTGYSTKLQRNSVLLVRLIWPCSWWTLALFLVYTTACRISLELHFRWNPAVNMHFPHLQETRVLRGVQFCCTAVPAPLGIPQQDRDPHRCDPVWTTWPQLRAVNKNSSLLYFLVGTVKYSSCWMLENRSLLIRGHPNTPFEY